MQSTLNRLSASEEYQNSVEMVSRLDEQMKGVLVGYNRVAAQHNQFPLSWEQLMIIQYDGGIDNLLRLNRYQNTRAPLHRFNKLILQSQNKEDQKAEEQFEEFIENSLRSRCSVLLKRVKGEMLLSHSTWDSYWALQRVFKYLEVGEQKRITYSSYPGVISSTDDFFILDGNLVVTETSLSLHLTNLDFQHWLSPTYNYIPEYLQVMAANHLSWSGEDWVRLMGMYKSAVYYS